MAGTLQAHQQGYLQHAAYVQAIGSRVEAYISRGHFLVQLFFGARHYVVQQSTFPQVSY